MNEYIDFFDNTCPLTGLLTEGRSTVKAVGSKNDLLYTFAPIGKVVFPFQIAIDLGQRIRQGDLEPRLDLSGLSRQAAERGEPPLLITHEVFGAPRTDVPNTFEEKREHFLQLFYDAGGNEYRERTINTFDDFPMAFASGAEQFFRIIKSLVADGLIEYDENSVVFGDWVKDIQAHFNGVLLTATARQLLSRNKPKTVIATITTPAISEGLAHLHPTIQAAASSLFATGHYRQALLDACIAIDNAVREKSQLTGSGTRLMEVAFSPGNPVLKIGDSSDEQQGFLALFRGLMLAVRNPKAHSLGGTADAQRALEWLSFASVLLRNLDEATLA